MIENIYALLVGINKYADAHNSLDTPPPLKGCLNDLRVFKEYLVARSCREGWKLHLQELTDDNATRNAVITGFREHLCQATNKDIVCFYYSGHGSRQAISPEVQEIPAITAR